MAHERGAYCNHCERRILAHQRELNSWAHAGLLLITCGLYLPIFVLVVIVHTLDCIIRGSYLCTRCGSIVR